MILGTAADDRYGVWLLNLIGSVKRNSDVFDSIVVYDLGLSSFQRRLLAGVPGVEVRAVPPFVPYWRKGFTWKTWIFRHLEADTLIWLDAGVTVLRPLSDLIEQIDERGYFAVSQGVLNRECIPRDYYGLYGISTEVGERVTIAAGILGFRRDSEFFSKVIVPTYEDALQGRTLGFSPGEAEKLNRGPERLDPIVLRDCARFRHDQTVLNIHFYAAILEPYVNDLSKYGGWKSPRDHPEQVIWGHRRRGDYRFLPRVPYRFTTAVVGIPWGTWIFLRANRRWLLHPSLYVQQAKRIATRVKPVRPTGPTER
jgi:hypothetical protein